jgi:hypothetical protein
MRYANKRQSLVGHTEQDPTNQHHIAATIALRSRLQRAVSPSLASVWYNASAGDQLRSHAAVSHQPHPTQELRGMDRASAFGGGV